MRKSKLEKTYELIQKREEIINKISKGYVQDSVTLKLLKGETVRFSQDYCFNKTYYSNKNWVTFNNLLDRLIEYGYELEILSGRNNSKWGTTVRITNLANQFGDIK